MPIQYVGLNLLNEKDIETLTRISEKELPKLERYYPNENQSYKDQVALLSLAPGLSLSYPLQEIYGCVYQKESCLLQAYLPHSVLQI